MNNPPWVSPSSAQVAVCTVWIPPLILMGCPEHLPWSWTLSVPYIILLLAVSLSPTPRLVISLKRFGCHGNFTLHPEFHCIMNLICTSCITNEYCTEFHPSFAQVQPHLHVSIGTLCVWWVCVVSVCVCVCVCACVYVQCDCCTPFLSVHHLMIVLCSDIGLLQSSLSHCMSLLILLKVTN